MKQIPSDLFRAYDIRGITTETLNPQNVYLIGLAFGSQLYELNEKQVVIGRDGRLSSPTLMQALLKGLLDSGCHVTDLGLVPTPLVYFAIDYLSIPNAIMLTGSHNPPDYNGLKLVMQRHCLHTKRIQALHKRIIEKRFHSHKNGSVRPYDLLPLYQLTMGQQIELKRPLRIAIDCGNGATGVLAVALFEHLGCQVTPLFCQVDGHFPNHSPDPTVPQNLKQLQNVVLQQQLDLGIAFDGDGDRMIAVDNHGKILWPDRMMMLFARDILARQPHAKIAFDVKCTHLLPQYIRNYQGIPLMCASGHSLLKAYMKQENAVLGGEFSGHLIFRDRWSDYDDGLYAAARLLQLVSQQPYSVASVFAALPETCTTPELKISVTSIKKAQRLLKTFMKNIQFSSGKVSTVDGWRVDFKEGWGLIRSSNTTPCLTLRFEAESEEFLQHLQNRFQDELVRIDSSLHIH